MPHSLLQLCGTAPAAKLPGTRALWYAYCYFAQWKPSAQEAAILKILHESKAAPQAILMKGAPGQVAKRNSDNLKCHHSEAHSASIDKAPML